MAKSLIATLIVAGFLFYLWEHRAQLGGSLQATPQHVLSLAALILLTWGLSGFQNLLTLRSAGLVIGLRECMLLTLAGTFGNYMPLRAGTLVRAVYLKKKHRLQFVRFGGISVLRTLLMFVAAGITGLLGLGLAAGGAGAGSSSALALLFALLVTVPLIMMLPSAPRLPWLPAGLQRIADAIADAYDELRGRRWLAAALVLLLIVQNIVLGIRFAVSADALGAELPVSHLLLMAPLATLISFAALTPGGLGLREAVMGYVSLALGRDFSTGVFVGTIDRGVLLLMVAVFCSAAFFTLWRELGATPKHRY